MKLFCIKDNKKRKTLFLDRDGVINKDRAGFYIKSKKEIHIYKSALKSLSKISQLGEYRLIILTNQSAIGRGIITEKRSRELNLYLNKKLLKANVKISGIYYCPHKPQDKCECRKPNIGLVKEAMKDFKIDIKNSFMVGDKKSDMDMARSAGLKGIFILTGQGANQIKKFKISYNYIIKDLRGLRKII